LSKENKMSRRAATTLAVLLVFGTASAVLADADNETVHHGSFAQRPASMMSNGRTGVVNDAVAPFTVEEKVSFAASELAVVRSAPFCRDGIAGRARAWIKLTEPGGKLIHINVEHVTSVRSDTQIPRSQGATRLDERQVSGRAGKCRAGHAVDLGHRGRSRER
jgi:hypothetical protein